MALLKPFSGTVAELDQVAELHEGYVYLTTDDQKLHADVENEEGVVERLTLNAENADFATVAAGLQVAGSEEVLTPDDFIRKQSGEEGDIIPIGQGGTGATDAATARTNLDVYSKNEAVENLAAKAFAQTLAAGGWSDLTYNLSLTDLKCGNSGDVPPIITCTDNLNEYKYITQAVATAGTGIVFTASKAPSADINIVIVDIK